MSVVKIVLININEHIRRWKLSNMTNIVLRKSNIHEYLRIECILLKFHWGMKALTEVHFQ
jgi:hypothetical protein